MLASTWPLSVGSQSKRIKNKRPGMSRCGFILKVASTSWMWDFGDISNSIVLQFFSSETQNKQRPLSCEGTCHNISQSLKERLGKTLVMWEVLKTCLFLFLLLWDLTASASPNVLEEQIW